ncbi:Guanine nucleotide-binding protein G(k) subunit alpha [Strongyloides ratti]|uniref:Guanine nucleotide-binding protein G(K) subunit alpha n=1 Tax=Strongyloides ratti TaxID=34506 RepID=A0A090L139_STRRB|nr:Guanine nucleotide-binding protein G(k) subunit alpha [Strongyloides ratti]CEF63500.1 Guanine nucleotide-binding protein G(k) subunit alpha [Strongyloides ratti]
MGNFCGVYKSNKTNPEPVPLETDIKKTNGKNDNEIKKNEDGRNENSEVEVKGILKNKIKNDEESDGAIRILLLGAPESGKSTLMEQIRLLYKQDFKDTELIHRKAFIYNNIVDSMKQIIFHMKEKKFCLENEDNEAKADFLLNGFENVYGPFDEKEIDCIKTLWNDKNIQEVYKRRGQFNLNDSAGYFFEEIDRINQPNFIPTPEDLVRAYVPTLGVDNLIFTAKNKSYQIIEYGGTKLDVKLIEDLYDGINCVFFVIAISEYDQFSPNDKEDSKFQNALKILDKCCNHCRDLNVPLYVFLNETDVFIEKLDVSPLSLYFDDYTGLSSKDALLFIHELVEERCSMHGLKDLHHETLCCCIKIDETGKMLEKIFKRLKK